MSRRGWLLFIALCVIWGIPYLLIRVAVRELPPPALIFLRTAPAALLLAPLALHRGELRPLLARWRWVVAYTVVEIAIPWLLLFHAELRLSSSLAALLVGAVPLIATVLYRGVGAGEHFDARRLTGLFIGFAGVAALVGIDTSGTDPLAIAEMLVVALCYATGPLIISRRLAGLPTLGVVTASLALTAVGYAPADDQRAGGVAERHDQHLRDGQRVGAGHVDADQGRHAGEADEQARQAARVEVLARAHRAVQH